ncbi:MAG TPA: hypothetical protein VIG33_00650, partial [Pseudobdellovibrionaceae bacterium]
VVKDSLQVAFNGFADSTLNILVNFHLAVFDANEELARQQKIFCEIIATGVGTEVRAIWSKSPLSGPFGKYKSSLPCSRPRAH